MLRIGIVGSQSSHTAAFKELINNGEIGRVTQIVDTDMYKTVDEVDAVIITERDGHLHEKIALHFIEQNIPIWVDKPFACKSKDAQTMVDYAEKKGVILTGGSTTKFVQDVQKLKNTKEITKAKISFASHINSEYNGLHFYGSHLVEMALEIFGRDFNLVSAEQEGEDVTALMQYDAFMLEMCFVKDNYVPQVYIETKDETISENIDISNCYQYGMEYFLNVLTGKIQPEPTQNLIQNVKTMEEILCLLNNG